MVGGGLDGRSYVLAPLLDIPSLDSLAVATIPSARILCRTVGAHSRVL